MESPVKLRAGDAKDLLFGDVRSLSGRPIDIGSLREMFHGAEFSIEGPGGSGTAHGVDVRPVDGNDRAATVIAYAGYDFVQRVREGRATADIPFGSKVPRLETRRAVPTRWVRDSEVVAEAIAPVEHWYDLEPYERQVGNWLPLVSDTGDMYEGQLKVAAHHRQDRRKLLLTLEIAPDLALRVKERRAALYVPLDLHG